MGSLDLSFGSLFPSLGKKAEARASPKNKLLSGVGRAGVWCARGGMGMPVWGWHPGRRASSAVTSAAEDATAFQYAYPPGVTGPKTSPKCLISNTCSP